MAFRDHFFKKASDKTEKQDGQHSTVSAFQEADEISIAEQMLVEVKTEISTSNAQKLPIAEILALGAGISSLLPPLRTISQVISTSGAGLYRLVNAGAGDALKAASDGNLWGALNTAGGGSRMAKFMQVGSVTSSSTMVAAINPAMLMMAVMLASIERRFDEVVAMEKQILSFLEEDKEAKVEGDLKTLVGILKGYKLNWDNMAYTASNHKLTLDIMRSAEQNMLFYQKQIAGVVKENPAIHMNQETDAVLRSLVKRFQYYRMSLYIYSFASFLEVMLLRNFQEAYVKHVRGRIDAYSAEYGHLFEVCSSILENMASGSVESNVLKGLGAIMNAAGSFVGSIPHIKDGSVDEWLSGQGSRLQESGDEAAQKTTSAFSTYEDPCCGMFLDNLRQVETLYNRAVEIYFDQENVYFVEDAT